MKTSGSRMKLTPPAMAIEISPSKNRNIIQRVAMITLFTLKLISLSNIIEVLHAFCPTSPKRLGSRMESNHCRRAGRVHGDGWTQQIVEVGHPGRQNAGVRARHCGIGGLVSGRPEYAVPVMIHRSFKENAHPHLQ